MILYNKQINVDDAAPGRRRHLFSMTSSSEYLIIIVETRNHRRFG